MGTTPCTEDQHGSEYEDGEGEHPHAHHAFEHGVAGVEGAHLGGLFGKGPECVRAEVFLSDCPTCDVVDPSGTLGADRPDALDPLVNHPGRHTHQTGELSLGLPFKVFG